MGDMESTRGIPFTSIDLDNDGLYFIAKDGDAWVYVDAEDRLVKVFNSLIDALAYGLHVSPGEITEVVAGEDKLRVCIGNECLEFKAWVD
jgi:hypothetical protein